MVKYHVVPVGIKKEVVGDGTGPMSKNDPVYEDDVLPRVGELFAYNRKCLSYRVIDVVHLGDEKARNQNPSFISHYVIVSPVSKEEHLKYFYE